MHGHRSTRRRSATMRLGVCWQGWRFPGWPGAFCWVAPASRACALQCLAAGHGQTLQANTIGSTVCFAVVDTIGIYSHHPVSYIVIFFLHRRTPRDWFFPYHRLYHMSRNGRYHRYLQPPPIKLYRNLTYTATNLGINF